MVTTKRIVNIKQLLEIKNKLEYIPDFWKVEELLSKNALDLSVEESGILSRINDDKNVLDKIDMLLSKLDDNSLFVTMSLEDSEMLDYIIYYSKTPDFILNKISKEDIDFVNNIIGSYDGTNDEEIKEVIARIENDFVRDYAYSIYKSKSASYVVLNSSKRLEEIRHPRYRLRDGIHRRMYKRY